MATAAAKEKRLLPLAAVCLVAAALLAPPASATRTTPSLLAPSLTAPAQAQLAGAASEPAELPATLPLYTTVDVVTLGGASSLDADQAEAVVARQRYRLHLVSGQLARSDELAQAQKTATRLSSWPGAPNYPEWSQLERKTHRPSYQGLWTDPTTGLSYARNRWYDMRSASWLSEDPMGAVDSPNLYAFVGWAPHMHTDPMGKCRWNDWECWGWVAKDFAGNTGHDLWNVASLGTLERVEQQDSLGTWAGVKESAGIAKDRIGNVGTLGAQDNLVAALEETGDLSGVPMAISKTAYDLTPMEEARLLIQEGDQLSTEEKIQVALTGVSKTAALGAVATGTARLATGGAATGSTSGTSTPRVNLLNTRVPTNASVNELLAIAEANASGPGAWAVVNESMSQRAATYQAQISGRPPGQAYVVENVRFDVFRRGTFGDAKGPGYATFVRNGRFEPWFGGAEDLVDQAIRQIAVSGGRPIVWSVAEEEAVVAMRGILAERGLGAITVEHVPAVALP